MSDKSDYYRDALQAHIRGGAALPQPAQFYQALSTTAPNPDGTNVTEPVGNGYAREPVNWQDNGSGVNENDALVRHGPASGGNWGTITHGVIYDAITGGNMWVYDALVTPRAVNDGSPLDFEQGSILWDEQ